jgi:hypothetical protein
MLGDLHQVFAELQQLLGEDAREHWIGICIAVGRAEMVISVPVNCEVRAGFADETTKDLLFVRKR